MNFSEVAHLFEQIEHTSSRLEMTRLLAQLFSEASAKEASIICYLSLGVLHPPYIGTQFNVAQKGLIRVIAQLCGISEHKVTQRMHELGDLGLVVQECQWKGKEISVTKVYEILHEIEKISGAGSVEEKATRLADFLRSCDPLSAKFIIRVVAGTLRLGFSDM